MNIRLIELYGPLPRYVKVAGSTAQWTNASECSELFKAHSPKCYKLMPHLHIHTHTDIFMKQRGTKTTSVRSLTPYTGRQKKHRMCLWCWVGSCYTHTHTHTHTHTQTATIPALLKRAPLILITSSNIVNGKRMIAYEERDSILQSRM